MDGLWEATDRWNVNLYPDRQRMEGLCEATDCGDANRWRYFDEKMATKVTLLVLCVLLVRKLDIAVPYYQDPWQCGGGRGALKYAHDSIHHDCTCEGVDKLRNMSEMRCVCSIVFTEDWRLLDHCTCDELTILDCRQTSHETCQDCGMHSRKIPANTCSNVQSFRALETTFHVYTWSLYWVLRLHLSNSVESAVCRQGTPDKLLLTRKRKMRRSGTLWHARLVRRRPNDATSM